MTIIPVRVNANLKTMVVEELVAQKKNIHLSAFSYVLDELQQDLQALADAHNAAERHQTDEWTGGISIQQFMGSILEEVLLSVQGRGWGIEHRIIWGFSSVASLSPGQLITGPVTPCLYL